MTDQVFQPATNHTHIVRDMDGTLHIQRYGADISHIAEAEVIDLPPGCSIVIRHFDPEPRQGGYG